MFTVNNSENEQVKVAENTVSDESNSKSKNDNSSSIKENNKKETNSKKTSSEIKWEYDELDDGTISIWNYETDNVPEVIEVPSEVDGKTVTEIERLFLSEDEVKKVVLPSTLTSIGIESFLRSESIEEIEINSPIEYIHGKGFYSCYNLKKLSFPEGLKKISDVGIFFTDGVEQYDIPPCNLEEIHMPGSIEMTLDELSHAFFIQKSTVLYAPAGSVWEDYAKEFGYKFVAE